MCVTDSLSLFNSIDIVFKDIYATIAVIQFWSFTDWFVFSYWIFILLIFLYLLGFKSNSNNNVVKKLKINHIKNNKKRKWKKALKKKKITILGTKSIYYRVRK